MVGCGGGAGWGVAIVGEGVGESTLVFPRTCHPGARAAQRAVVGVQRVVRGHWVLVRQEGDVAAGFGQVVEQGAVVRFGDGARGQRADETLTFARPNHAMIASDHNGVCVCVCVFGG